MNSRHEFMNSAAGITCAAPTGSLMPEAEGPRKGRSAKASTNTSERLSAEGSPSTSKLVGTTRQPSKRDYRSRPFRVAVAVGDAVAAGGDATSPELCWVSRLADAINESQLEPVKVYNNGMGANVISQRSPAYNPSRGPSAMERYHKHLVAYDPDLALISYGLNDARGGMPLAQFLEDERQIVLDVKKQTNALIVVVDANFMTAFDRWPPYDRANVATFMGFNCGLKRMAEECDVLYADVFASQGEAAWMVDPENGVHPNNLGHRVIADRIFAVLAQNCSCLSRSAFELRKTMKPWRQRETELQKEFYQQSK
jgi:lysophospholipase L1-like esterase